MYKVFKLVIWYLWIKDIFHFIFLFTIDFNRWGCVTTLALGSRPKQRFARMRAKREAQTSHFVFLGAQKSVKEWTLTLPRELPLWELESQWASEFSENDHRGQNSLDWGVLYIIGKFLERRCLKWARVTHLESKTQVMVKRRARSQTAH
jgi:hypothetical protein